MITKNDIIGFLEDVKVFEEKMRVTYLEMIEELSDEKYKEIFYKLSEDEVSHTKMVKEIENLMNG